jgi:hypothetical protein
MPPPPQGKSGKWRGAKHFSCSTGVLFAKACPVELFESEVGLLVLCPRAEGILSAE